MLNDMRTVIDDKNTANFFWDSKREQSAKRGKNGKFGGAGNTAAVVSAATVAGAVGLGMGHHQYKQVLANYHSSLDKRLPKIKQNSEAMNVELPAGKKNVMFVVGGLDGTTTSKSSHEIKAHMEKMYPDSHVVPIDTNKFNTKSSINAQEKPIVWAANNVLQMPGVALKPIFKEGHNPVAEDIATQALAYHKKYGVPIHAVGHSGGGVALHEAHLQLNKLGVSPKTIAVGSPHFGVISHLPKNEHMTLYSKKDPLSVFPTLNGKQVNSVGGHALNQYFENPEFKSEVSQFFKGKH